ncbi:hypothetical protein, partial [Enterobacter intestinihominis]
FLVSLKSFMGELRYWPRKAGPQRQYTVGSTPKRETTQDIHAVMPPINATKKKDHNINTPNKYLTPLFFIHTPKKL